MRMIEKRRLWRKGAFPIYWTAAKRQIADWRRGLGALLSDQAALAAALSDQTLLPEFRRVCPLADVSTALDLVSL